MTLWKERSTLFTLGGYNGSYLKEVQEYSIAKNIWNLHSQLPHGNFSSSALVLNAVIYNIGGEQSSHSLLWCNLSRSLCKWKPMDLVYQNVQGFWLREAFTLENKIVYFGSWNKNATFVLEQEQETEQLKVVREDDGLFFLRGYWNGGSCAANKEIYAFKTLSQKDVYRYSWRVENGVCSIHTDPLIFISSRNNGKMHDSLVCLKAGWFYSF